MDANKRKITSRLCFQVALKRNMPRFVEYFRNIRSKRKTQSKTNAVICSVRFMPSDPSFRLPKKHKTRISTMVTAKK